MEKLCMLQYGLHISSNLEGLWHICLSSYERTLLYITWNFLNYIANLILMLDYITTFHLYRSQVTWYGTMIRKGYDRKHRPLERAHRIAKWQFIVLHARSEVCVWIQKVNQKFWVQRVAYIHLVQRDSVENYAPNNSWVVARVFVAALTFLPRSCLTTRGWYTCRYTRVMGEVSEVLRWIQAFKSWWVRGCIHTNSVVIS
jgi:hypothetical protein